MADAFLIAVAAHGVFTNNWQDDSNDYIYIVEEYILFLVASWFIIKFQLNSCLFEII